MKGLVALALVASIGNATTALAGETILKSGARHVQQLATTSASTSAASTTATQSKTAPSLASQGASTLSKSGMSKGKKVLIYAGLAAAFVGGAWAIDHRVNDITPSSLGTRQD